MDDPQDRSGRGYLTSAGIANLFPMVVARIARGNLTYSERGKLNERAAHIEPRWRAGLFNGIEYFHLRFPEQGALLAAFLLQERLHRIVPESLTPASPEEVEAEWRRMAEQRGVILAWARERKALMDIVQSYRFERRCGAYSNSAHAAAAEIVKQIDHTVSDPMTYAGVCIEWAEREHREWFWRCAPNHQLL